jgi:hypothetical protein
MLFATPLWSREQQKITFYRFYEDTRNVQIFLSIYPDNTFVMNFEDTSPNSDVVMFLHFAAGYIVKKNSHSYLFEDKVNNIYFEASVLDDDNILLCSKWVFLNKLRSKEAYKVNDNDFGGNFNSVIGKADSLASFLKIIREIRKQANKSFEENKINNIICQKDEIKQHLKVFDYSNKFFDIQFLDNQKFRILVFKALLLEGSYQIKKGIIKLKDNSTDIEIQAYVTKNNELVCSETIPICGDIDCLTYRKQPKTTSNEKK